MQRHILLMAIGAALCLPALAAAQESGLPPGGVSLLGSDPLTGARLAGPAARQAELSVVPATGQSFERVLRVETRKPTRNDADIQVAFHTAAPIQSGDVLHIRFWARTTKTTFETGTGRIRILLGSRSQQPPAAFLALQATPGSEWERFDFPIAGSRIALAAGQGLFTLRLGGTGTGVQTVEIGGLQVLNYGKRLSASDLPHKRISYGGREPDAPWRKEAAERIEKYRKGDLRVQVVDAAGRPVAGAGVQVKMTRHAYKFGSAVNDNWLLQNWNTPNGERYRREFNRLFNKGGPANALKWMTWEEWSGKGGAEKLVNWLAENKIEIHGHVLVWPAWRYAPRRVGELKNDPDKLRAAIREHITFLVAKFKDRIPEWDVLNESFGNRDFMNILGREEMAEWFKLAHAADPGARLFINENSILSGQKLDFYMDEIHFLQKHGAPIHAIGVQGHVGPIPMTRALASLDKLATLGLPIEITEFDIVTPDDEMQGEFTRDLLTIVFSHPATTGFVMWGFWDGQHWLHDAPIFYRDWTLKPSGKAYEDLVLGAWWTDEKGVSGSDGTVKIRGFLGEHEVTVRHGGRTQTVRVALTRDGSSVRVALK